MPLGLNAQIQVRLHRPPPYQLMIERLWWVDLDNPTQTTYTVYLHAEIIEAQKGLIFKANSNTFMLPPGEKRIRPRDITDVRDVWYASGYKEYIIRTGKVPEGNYTVCIYVIDARTNQELGDDCFNSVVRFPESPRLISPKDKASVKGKHPVFTWTPPVPVPPGEHVEYNLKIVEVLKGQTKEEAIRSNIPWFTEQKIKRTSLVYPTRARSFESGITYAWQIQVFDKNGFPLGKNHGMSEIWEFGTEVLIPVEPLPRVLCMGEFILRNITYESGSTLESLSGTAESYFIQRTRPGHFGGPIFIFTDIPFIVNFTNLKATSINIDTGQVVEGEIIEIFSLPVEVLVEDFYPVYVHDIHLLPDSARGNVGVGAPCIYEETGCAPAEFGPFDYKLAPHIEIYKELGIEDRGPFRIGETGILIISKEQIEIDLSRTISPTEIGITLKRGETIEQPDMDTSNTGYLYGKYTFDDGRLTPLGFSATLELSSTWNFFSLAPMGFQISLYSGFIEIDSCKVIKGEYTAGYITLPQGVNGVHNKLGNPVIVSYDTLLVDSLLNLSSIVKISGEIQWGGFGVVSKTGKFRLVSDPRPFLEPVQADSFKIYTSAELDTLTGLTFKCRSRDTLIVYSPDAKNPIRFSGEMVRGWLNLEMQGLSGKFIPVPKQPPALQVYLGDTAQPHYVADKPFTTIIGHYTYYDIEDSVTVDSLMNIEFEFAGNSAFDSDIGGQFKIPIPCNISPPFNDLEVTSTASFVGGNVSFSDTLDLDYWGVGISSKRGVVSVKIGEIVYTDADIHEPIHFAQGFNVIWGEMLADGGLGEFFFNHNSAYQRFDGIPITLDSAALSKYNPSIPGELVVRSNIHFNFFGAPDTLITIHDAKYTEDYLPYFGRIIQIDPYDFSLFRHWGSELAVMDFDSVSYDSVDQNGFKGTGYVDLEEFFPDSPFPAHIWIDSVSIGICMSETNAHELFFHPINLASVSDIWGCIYINGDELHRLAIGAILHTGAGSNALLPQTGSAVSVTIAVTPTISKFACHGLMYIGTAIGQAEVNGRILLSYDRSIQCLEGEIHGDFDFDLIVAGGLEAEGQVNWHFDPGAYWLQGRLAVKIHGLKLGGGLAGGVFLGNNAPKEKAWVLREGSSLNRKFGVDFNNLPNILTGVYVFGDADITISFYGLFSGGIETYAGAGAFVNEVSGLPYALGVVGVYIHGEILWGVVSVSAWGELEMILGDPIAFQGTIGLKGCVLYIFCASVDVTVGLSSTRGLYIQ